MHSEHWNVGGIEKIVGVVDGARCHTIAALGKKRRELLVLLFCLAGVVHGKTDELWFLTRSSHQRHEASFPLDDLVLQFRKRELIGVLVRVGVIAQIEFAPSPVSEYLDCDRRTKILKAFLDHEACDRGVMMPQRGQYLPIDLFGYDC